jgi:hypothetical protein
MLFAHAHTRNAKIRTLCKLTSAIGIVTAVAPACAHAAACITPDTEVKLTLILSSHCRLAAAAIPASVAGIYSLHGHTYSEPRAKFVTRQGLAYRHHNRAPVSAEHLETRDKAACLCDQHAGVIAVLAWIEYCAMHAGDKFQERIAQLPQLWQVVRICVRGRKSTRKKVNGGLSGLPAVESVRRKWLSRIVLTRHPGARSNDAFSDI